MTISSKREIWLDLVKGIAIVCVVIQHSLQRTMYYYDKWDCGLLDISNLFINTVNMQWFFVVSGYVYMLKRSSYLSSPIKFVKNKFVDLMIPYFILGPMVWLGKFTFSAYVRKPVGFEDLFNMFTFPIVFMWFIYVLFIIEILILIIDMYFKIRYELLLFILLIIHISLYITTGKGKDIFHMVPFFMFWYYLGGFFIIYKKFISEKQKILKFSGLIIWLLGFIIFIYTGLKIFGVIYALGSVAFLFLYFQNRFCCNRNINQFMALINYFGKKSMYIYILNPVIINTSRVVLVKLGVLNIYVNFLSFFLIAISIACLISEIASHVPVIEFIFSPRKYFKKYI